MLLDKDEIERASEDLGLSVTEVENIDVHFWRFLRSSLRSKDIQPIKIMYFGTFKPKYNRIKYSILAAIKNIRAGKNVEYNRKKLSSLWKARNTLIETNQTRYYG